MAEDALRSLQLLLRDPSTFFEEHEPAATLPIAAGVVVALAVTLVVAILLVGSMLAGTLDATVTMDNPDRPPEWVCEQYDSESPFGSNCDEPETIERDAGSLVYEAATDYLVYVAIAPFVMWVLGGVVLFGAARLANGTPSLAGTFALAGWAALPELFRTVVSLLALRYAFSDVTITDPERSLAIVEGAIAPIEPVLALTAVLTAAWQWWLLTDGLVHDAELTWAAAATATGIPLVIWLVVVLV